MSAPTEPRAEGPAPHGVESIVLDDVSVTLGGRTVLEKVSIRLEQRRIAVIGANGSGKSTFARLLNGLVSPTSGRALVHGLDPAREAKRVRRAVGFVFTNPDAQILMPTVAEDLRFSLRGSGLTRDEVAERVAAVLADYGLGDHAEAPAYSLSGGQKQLLALAAVLIRDPRLVVADEPTTLLDLTNAERMGDILINELTAQTVLVTHDLELAERCEVAIRFRAGHVEEVGDPAQVVDRYRREHRARR